MLSELYCYGVPPKMIASLMSMEMLRELYRYGVPQNDLGAHESAQQALWIGFPAAGWLDIFDVLVCEPECGSHPFPPESPTDEGRGDGTGF